MAVGSNECHIKLFDESKGIALDNAWVLALDQSEAIVYKDSVGEGMDQAMLTFLTNCSGEVEYRCRAICYGQNRVLAYDDAEVVGLAYLAESKPVVDYRCGQKEVRMLGSEEEVSAFRKDWERERSECRQRQTGVSR